MNTSGYRGWSTQHWATYFDANALQFSGVAFDQGRIDILLRSHDFLFDPGLSTYVNPQGAQVWLNSLATDAPLDRNRRIIEDAVTLAEDDTFPFEHSPAVLDQLTAMARRAACL